MDRIIERSIPASTTVNILIIISYLDYRYTINGILIKKV